MKKTFILIAAFLPLLGFCQDREYVRTVLDTLCSPYVHGRGYVNDGHSIAADYIASEFERIGLSAYAGGYLQSYPITVNTFPGKVEVAINGKNLIAGEDYLCLPYSGPVKGEYELVWINHKILKDQKKLKKLAEAGFSDKFLVLDEAGVEEENHKRMLQSLRYQPLGAKGVIVIQDNKLTHGFFQDQAGFAGLEILRSSLPKKAKTIQFEIESELKELSTQNVVGFVKGNKFPDSLLVFSAHYDHLGRMGETAWFPGANDNASGVAILLDLARHYKKNPHDCAVAFIAFGAEEVGLLGSKYFVEHPLFPLEKIGFVLNMDIMGTGDEGITVVNGTVHQREFDLLSSINQKHDLLPQVKKRGETANSDHYWFSENGVPAFFIYTMGGIKAYHDIYDRPETLPLTKYEQVYQLLVRFMSEL